MPVSRRGVLRLGLASTVAAVAGCGGEAPTADGPSGPGSPGTSSPGTTPPGTTAGTTPAATRTTAAGASDPLSQKLAETLRRYLRPSKENPDHPTYAGAVALVTVGGKTIATAVVGEALRYGSGAVLLPESQRVAMRPDSIFDLASITKVYTAIVGLQLVDRGLIDLAAPVVTYLPEFTGSGKSAITVAQLLAHTSGLPVGPKFSGLSTVAEKWNAVLTGPMLAGATPGTVFRYSGLGLMVLGRMVEKLTGKRLDDAVRTHITGPLGLRYTGFNPTTWLSSADRAKLVATDARTSRGLLRGVVHDDICNQLGGIAGHAGLFGTAADVAAIGQLILRGGSLNGVRILSESITRRMLTNANAGLPAVDPERPFRTSTHGLGVELDQPWFMGKLSSPRTFGHTGFTGTSILGDPDRDLVLVLLTNRAHPNWSWANPDPIRAAVATVVSQYVS